MSAHESHRASRPSLPPPIRPPTRSYDECQRSATNLRAALNKRTAQLRSFSGEVYDIVQGAKEPAHWAAGAQRLFEAYVPADLPVGAGDISVIAESERQKEHLEALNAELKRAGEAANRAAKGDNARLVEENLSLISQIKSLREAIAGLRLQLKTIAVDKARAQLGEKAAALQAASAARSRGGRSGRHQAGSIGATMPSAASITSPASSVRSSRNRPARICTPVRNAPCEPTGTARPGNPRKGATKLGRIESMILRWPSSVRSWPCGGGRSPMVGRITSGVS